MRYDTWDLKTLREAKAYRDTDPALAEPMLDAMLAEAEAQHAARVMPTATPVADEARPQGRGGDGRSNYGSTANAPTGAQLSYLDSLARQLGHELQTPRDKRHASLIIDGAKAELAKRPRQWTGTGPEGRPVREAVARPERMATPGQQSYLAGLLASRVHDHGDLDPATVTFAQATSMIDRLRLAPWRPKETVAPHGIPTGHYAVERADGVVGFYRVTDGGSIKVIAGPEEHPYRGKLNTDLETIKADLQAAAALYGRKIGRCGRCHRRLTDETSRSIGLGPDCAAKAW